MNVWSLLNDLLICSLLLFVIVRDGSAESREDEYVRLKNSLETYTRTGKKPPHFELAVRDYNTPNFFKSPVGTFDNRQLCTLCELFLNLLIRLQKNGDFVQQLEYFCSLLKIENERVCKGMVKLNVGVFTNILDRNPHLNGTDVCGIVFQNYGCTQSDRYEWEIEIPPGNTVEKSKTPSCSSFNVLHITDIHYDPLYTTNKTNDCGEPVCCQYDQPDGTNHSNSCGYWAEYKLSDIPWRTVVKAFEQTTTHDYDYVYFTGDIISHRVWETSIVENSRVIEQVLDAFSEYYKVPVYPILGNHEPHPVNLFSVHATDKRYSTQWLFDIMFQKLSKWLPIDEVKDTILKGGYYTVSPKKGFRVIVLNNALCYLSNWWLVDQPKDPFDQLKWLTEVLLRAERNGEKVHILFHVPTGVADCYKTWSREYGKIINRFANTITGQFNGHEHRDEFYVFYNRSNLNQAINIAWNGASVVTFDNANPSYKVYSIDNKNYNILDIEEWTFNVTLANKYPNKDPKWYKLYSFKDAWGVKNLDDVDIDDLVQKMTTNHELLDQFNNFKFKNSDVVIAEGCDDKCKKAILCRIVTTDGDLQLCDKFSKMYEDNN